MKNRFLLLLSLFFLLPFHGMASVDIPMSTEQVLKTLKVTIQLKDKKLDEILSAISKQTKIDYAYQIESGIDKNKLYSLSCNNIAVESALNALFKIGPYTYRVIDDRIVIVVKDTKPSVTNTNKIVVNGLVVDEDHQPLVGATVFVVGTKHGVITGADGKFKLSCSENDTLEVSFTGMKTKEIIVKHQEKELTIKMQPDVLAVDEVVVNGYYTKSKESLTGSAVVIKSDELQRVSSSNIISALQTFDPSFRIADNIEMGSNPNALPDFRIRGNSGLGTISEGALKGTSNLPTFILDGYEVSVEKIYDLDMNRVESVTILKDASATAIYGSRAANGVVVVNTKAPKAGKLSVSYNFNGTIQAPDLSDYNLVGAKDKLYAERLAGRYDYKESEKDPAREQQLRLDYASRYRSIQEGVDTYWLSQPVRTAFGHKHSLLIEGGDEAIRYAVDANYQAGPGVMKNSSRDRFGVGFQLSYNYKNKLLFRNYLTINKVKAKESNYGLYSDYTAMNPYYRPYDDNGNLIEMFREESGNVYNPLHQSTIGNINENSYSEWSNNFDFDWHITNSLRLKTRFAYSEKNDDAYNFISPNALMYGGSNMGGEAKSTNGRSHSFDGNIVLSYNKFFNRHSINAVIGGNIVEKKYITESTSVRGFSNESLNMPSFAAEYVGAAPTGDEGTTRLAGAFANFSYGFANKYLFDVSFRLDGSSIYGADKRSSPFWSLGLAWNIHKENFLKNSKVISQLKLMGNLGISGKASFQPYESRTSFEFYRGKTYGGVTGATLMAMGNNDLKWETTTLKDLRIEIGLWEDRVSVSGNYYLKDTKDLLTDVTLPYSSGFKSYKENAGSLRNEGFEVNVKYFIVRNSKLNVNIYGALVHNKNSIKKISNALMSYNDDIDKSMNNQDDEDNKYVGTKPKIKLREGESTSAIYAMRSLGINPANGQEMFVSRDGTISYVWDAREQIVCGDTEPKISGTLGANIDYKGFNVNFNFLYEMGGYVYNQTLVSKVENANIAYNVDRRVLNDRWQEPGDDAFFKNIRDNSATNVTSRFVQKNNFLRLQSLSLAYTFDNETIKNLGVERLKVSVLMNDVFRVATVEQERGLSYPFARSFNINLQIQF